VDTGETRPRAVVVGGGIAGLTAAYRLRRLAAHVGSRIDVVLIESSRRTGGIIETVIREGCTVERGPDSMITEKPWGVRLCGELGIGDAVLATNPVHRRSFIARGDRLHSVPDGFHLMAPSKLMPFALSSILSAGGKMRVAMEPFVRARRDAGDESLASFVRRRLGAEVLERIAQPMVGGIYTADPERLSLLATLPRFLHMERDHGSVTRGLAAAAKHAASGVATASGPRYGLFVSLDEGMEQLARTLVAKLPADAVRLGVAARSVVAESGRWHVETTAGRMEADAVCIATPARAAAALLERQAPSIARELVAIESASTAIVNLAYTRSQIRHALDGFGFVVPAVERRTTLACTFSSVKFPGRAPDGVALLRAFVGGALFPAKLGLDDARLVAEVRADLSDLLGAHGDPQWTLVTRYRESMPQYYVGHLDRVGRIEAALEELPGLALAGNAYRGTGIPDCIHSGEEAADRLADALLGNRR
jgi:oxygen-dependent protoporphyrinogen oxidase